MNKLRNISIGFRLSLGFLMLCIFILSIGTLAIWDSNQHIKTIDNIFRHPYTISNTVQEIETHIVSIHRSMKDVSLSNTNLEIANAVDLVNRHENEIIRLFSIVSKEFLGDKKDVDAAWSSFKEWKPIRLEVIDLSKSGNKQDAAQITKGKGAKHVKNLNEKVSKMKDFANSKAENFHQSSIEQNNYFKRIIIISLVLVILISLLIAFLITQSIRRPIKSMNQVSKAIQKGNLAVQNTIRSNDELDVLGGSINEMANSLKSRINILNSISTINKSLIGESDIHQFANKLLKNLIAISNSSSGRFYILEENRFTCISSISSNPNHVKSFLHRETPSEFGLVMQTKKLQLLKNLDQNPNFDFTTSIGNYSPKEILSFPIISDNKVIALISLTNLENYHPESIEILSLSNSNINTSFSNILATQKTSLLVQSLSKSNQTLELQSEELKEQAQELQNQTFELNEQNRFLALKTEEVEQANRLKSEFLSNMSHELRTPLNSIMALSRTLIMQTSEKLNEEENSYLKIVERNGKNLLKLINDILDLSKIEAGKMDIYPSSVNLVNTLQILKENLHPLAAEKNIQLELIVINDLPEIETDEMRLSQILINLINNAIKFTEKGKVTISAYKKDANVNLEIRDTGIGISDEYIKSIFDEFRQIDGSSSRQYEGTGLGLTIVKKLISKIGGQINVSSKSGSGSCFYLSIPIQWHKKKLTTPLILSSFPKVIGKSSQSNLLNPDGARILIIEDNQSAIVQIKQVLENNGYIVDVALGGKQAYEYMRTRIPDGIILDIMMPEIDGFEVLETVRRRKATANIPIVILTAKDLSASNLNRLNRNNIHQLIQKGAIDIDALLNSIQSMVSKNLVSDQVQPSPKQISKIILKDGEKAKVLIIEDNADNMITIKSILYQQYDIYEATDGEIGLQMTKEIIPDIILLDIALPKIDGIELTKRLKKDVKTQHIPIIALTARAMYEDKIEIMNAGCNEYVTKPIDHTEILDKIQTFFY
jgi:signal transduction histidine kinase/DNA-binding response OmpR family regulator/HAMP domain-containing protein